MPVNNNKIPRRIAAGLLNSLKGGVVPRVGLPYIVVGRKAEIDTFLHDLTLVEDGGASFRFIVGKYGAGKSFLLQTLRNYMMERDFIVMDADLSPERRLKGSKGEGLATYRELTSNLSTKTKPEGGALPLVLDRWVDAVQNAAAIENDLKVGDPALTPFVDQKITDVMESLGAMIHGFEFAKLLSTYYHACLEKDVETKGKVVRWFRGEYAYKRDAKQELGVNLIITDDDWYEYLKIFATFFRLAGYSGLIVMIDELVNLFNIVNSAARQNNYDKILTMYNDVLQGRAKHLGIILGSTPQALDDKRRGVFSYDALRSRLTNGKFGQAGPRNLLAPVVLLNPLTPAEMLVLCEKLADIHAEYYGYQRRIAQDDLAAFITAEFQRVGAATNITPREVIRDFIGIADVLYQDPNMTVSQILNDSGFSFATSDDQKDNANNGSTTSDDDPPTFTL